MWLDFDGKRFGKQLAVDSFVKVEGQRLDYIHHNETQIRADNYQGLIEHVENRARERKLFVQIILLYTLFFL